MTIFNVLELIGGLALFLFGMNIMGDALEKRAGDGLKSILEKLTSNRFKGFILGLGVTAIIQSSSATTVMVVGFVNSGIMSLSQAIGIIMGANVGTTVTSWLLTLTGIQSSNTFLTLLKPSSFTPVLAMIGLIMIMKDKHSKGADTGMILLGFAVLMYGMEQMSGAVSPLKEVPEFRNILLMFSNPILGVMAGAVLTAIIQSSSASVGILQALASTGAVTYGSAIPIIMGQNIGTCVTAMISSVGANKNAKRTAVVHLFFNIIGTVVWLTVFMVADKIIGFTFTGTSVNVLGIAVVHTTFNVLCVALLFPFANQLEKLACLIVKDDEQKESMPILDERLMTTPAIAIDRCGKVLSDMLNVTVEGVKKACTLADNYDLEVVREVADLENKVDKYEDILGTYLVKVSSLSLNEGDSHRVSKMLRLIGEVERISDHSVSISNSYKEIRDKKLHMSEAATAEISVIMHAVLDVLDKTAAAYNNNDSETAIDVESLEKVIDVLSKEEKVRHIERLQAGICTIEQGFIMSDIMTALERISDHCANVAECVEEISNERLGVHQYAKNLREENQNFQTRYELNLSKYSLENIANPVSIVKNAGVAAGKA